MIPGDLLGGLSFAAPVVLVGLLILPALYFLLRATPPAPRRQIFPPLRLLRGIAPTERSPARLPLWLLILRLFAAALVIVGFAGPEIVPPRILPGAGPILLAIDNGWAAAAGF
ncbi:MAG TPA: BatA domain-containing protein, partial [Acidiphilium sp.]